LFQHEGTGDQVKIPTLEIEIVDEVQQLHTVVVLEGDLSHLNRSKTIWWKLLLLLVVLPLSELVVLPICWIMVMRIFPCRPFLNVMTTMIF